MSFFIVGTQRLVIPPGGGAYTLAGDIPPDPPEGVTHILRMEYVDATGVFREVTVVPDGDPVTVTGVAPFVVWFDASDTVTEASNATTVGAAWSSLGHRFDGGEGLSGTWSVTGGDKNVVTGAGIMGYVYTTAGTHTFRHWVRDSDARQSMVSVQFVISAPAAGIDIGTGGSWPTWASNTVYNLAAGTNHSSKGTINLSGLHNVIIRKVGVGADPIVTRLQWDGRNVVNTAVQRTRACRTVGLDIGTVAVGAIGTQYCAVVGGNARRYAPDATWWYWENETSTETQRNNICYSRGVFFWDSGELVSNPSDTYPIITQAKNFCARNVNFRKTLGDGGSHVFRGQFNGLDVRHCRFRSDSGVGVMSYMKIHGWDNGSTFDAWRADDRFGLSGVRRYQYVCSKIAISNNIYGASGANNSVGTNIELFPENETGAAQAEELVSLQDNVWFVSSWVGMANSFGGRFMQYYNNKLNMGAGSEASYSTGGRSGRIPSGWNGPYVYAARPVVVV